MILKFSVIIPTFNPGKVLTACLESIVNQTYENKEVVIVDGKSSHATLEIITRYAALFPNIRWTSEKDTGIYDAMNKGIGQVTGNWLLFLGADDQLADNEVLSRTALYLAQTNAQLVYGNVKISGSSSWAKDGDVYDGEFDLDKLFRKNICHQAIFYRRSIFETIGTFNLNYPVCADWDLNHRCFGSAKVEYIPETISIFHSGGLSTVGDADGFYRDAVFNLKSYHRISYLNRLFHHYTDAFHLNAGLYFKQKKILQAIRFYLYFLYHKFL